MLKGLNGQVDQDLEVSVLKRVYFCTKSMAKCGNIMHLLNVQNYWIVACKEFYADNITKIKILAPILMYNIA